MGDEETSAAAAIANIKNLSTVQKSDVRPFLHELIIQLVPKKKLPNADKHRRMFLEMARNLTMRYYPTDGDGGTFDLVAQNIAKMKKFGGGFLLFPDMRGWCLARG
jgi:hypothetical protein